MTLNIEKLLDPTGRKLLQLLQTNARLPFSELGRVVGLSTPAVTERVRRMEEAGLILGYHAEVNREKLGYIILAFIRVTTTPAQYPKFLTQANHAPEIVECHHVTGSESFILKVQVMSIPDLERLIEALSRFGQTATSIVLSSPVMKKAAA